MVRLYFCAGVTASSTLVQLPAPPSVQGPLRQPGSWGSTPFRMRMCMVAAFSTPYDINLKDANVLECRHPCSRCQPIQGPQRMNERRPVKPLELAQRPMESLRCTHERAQHEYQYRHLSWMQRQLRRSYAGPWIIVARPRALCNRHAWELPQQLLELNRGHSWTSQGLPESVSRGFPLALCVWGCACGVYL